MAKDFTRTLQSDAKGASDTAQPTAKKTWQPRSPQQTQSQQPSREAEIVEALKAPDFAKEIAQILKDRNEPVVDAEEFIRHAIRQIQSPDLEAQDKLVLCTPASVQAAVKKLAVMGLSPNADQGEGWLVPRWSKKAGTLLAKPVPGVRGMERKLMETGKVAIIESRAIYLQDFCTVKLGTEKSIQHEVNFCPDPEKPNPIIGSYGIVELKDGRREIAVKRLYRPAGPRKGQDPQEQSQENNAGQERAGYMDEETSACYAAQRPAMKGALNKFFKDNESLRAIAEMEDQSYESAMNPEAKRGVALTVDPLQNAIVIPRAQVPGTSPLLKTDSQPPAPNGNKPPQHPVDQIIEGVRHQYGDGEPVSLNKEVNVIRHHFQGGNRSLQLGRFLFQEFPQAFFDGVYQNRAAILRAPNQVKLERVDRAAILCVPGNNHRSCIIQLTENKSLRNRQFRRQLKQAVALPT